MSIKVSFEFLDWMAGEDKFKELVKKLENVEWEFEFENFDLAIGAIVDRLIDFLYENWGKDFWLFGGIDYRFDDILAYKISILFENSDMSLDVIFVGKILDKILQIRVGDIGVCKTQKE